MWKWNCHTVTSWLLVLLKIIYLNYAHSWIQQSLSHMSSIKLKGAVYRKVSVRHTALLLCAKAVFPLCRLDVIYNIGLYSAPIIVTQWTCLLKQVNAVFVSVIFFKTAFVLNVNNWDRAVIMCTSLLRSHSQWTLPWILLLKMLFSLRDIIPH